MMKASVRYMVSWIALIGALVTACSRSEKPAGREARSDSLQRDSAKQMADMPGMEMPGKEAKPDTVAPNAESAEGTGMLPSSVAFNAAQIQHGNVSWARTTTGAASGTAIVPGELSPDEDRTARLGAPARGRILSVAVRPGDRVAAGQLLVTMQSPEAGIAQGDVAKAEAELSSRRAEAQYAARARARAERLLTLKAIPRQDYDRAVTDDERARAATVQAEAEVRRARATAQQLSAGTSMTGEIALRAPAAGVVLTRSAVPGTVVEAGAPLVVVTDPANLWLIVNTPEQTAALFHRGGRLRFTVPAYPADTFTARVDAVGAGLDPDTRTLSVRGIVESSGGRLKPAMLANVVVEGIGSTQAAFVPEDAVQLVQGRPNVFIAHPDGKGGARFDRREVVVGARTGGRVAILRGVSPNDLVVTRGAFAVKAQFQKATMPKMEM